MKRQTFYLANALKDRNNLFKIAHMEDWKDKFDVTKMTVAFLQAFHTGIAPIILIRYSHPLVEGAMGVDGSIALEIE
jgi:hypothetical protein